MTVSASVRRAVLRARALIAWARALAYRILDTVPPVRRTVDELLRVEFVDRAVVIAAQALLALVPLVVVLAAYFPHALHEGLARFQGVTGLTSAQAATATPGGAGVTVQIGVVGIVVTVVSASSFARAVMRMYARVWGLSPDKGVRGRGRALLWLLVWLAALQLMALGARVVPHLLAWLPSTIADPVESLIRVVAAILLWSWTMRFLLTYRVPWRRLWVAGVLTGVASSVVVAGSRVVMPRYTASSAQQFGTFGLVLAVAAWLVVFAEVLVVAAVVGRVLAEDPFTRRWTKILVGSVPLLRRVPVVRRWTGEHLDHEQRDRGDEQQGERPGPGRVVGEDVHEEHDSRDRGP
jgi:membrane protein